MNLILEGQDTIMKKKKERMERKETEIACSSSLCMLNVRWFFKNTCTHPRPKNWVAKRIKAKRMKQIMMAL
jgi:hypothetical protein